MQVLSEQLTPQVVDERIKAAREIMQVKIDNIDQKYDRWATTMDEDIDEVNKKVDNLDKDVTDKLNNLAIAQERGERLVQKEAEKARIEKNRWMIGTVLAVAGLCITIIADIILK